jgi:transposase InsO family protein
LRKWLANIGVRALYIEPGSPWENDYIERFNAKLRDEFLIGETFYMLEKVRAITGMWREHYNKVRPHGVLGSP